MEDPVRIREARPGDIDKIAWVHVDSWRSTYQGIAPDDVLAGLSYEGRARQWLHTMTEPGRQTHVFVAEERNGEVIGVASVGPERSGDPDYAAELYVLYLRQEHQRRGVGRRLVAAATDWLSERGMTSMLLWVLEDNPSRGFYERLGGTELREQAIQMGNATLTEVAYGWRDITPLRRLS